MTDPASDRIEATSADRAKFLEHFPYDSDLTLQALKGQLLVEELLRELLDMQLPHPLALRGNKGTSLDCHQVICLVEAITPQSQIAPWVWGASKKLNGIRNDLAHKLAPSGLADKIADFIKYVKTEEPRVASTIKKIGSPESVDFPLIISSLCAALASLKPELKKPQTSDRVA